MSHPRQPPWSSTPEEGEREYPHWNRVYIAVVVFTVVVILALWLFQFAFST